MGERGRKDEGRREEKRERRGVNRSMRGVGTREGQRKIGTSSKDQREGEP